MQLAGEQPGADLLAQVRTIPATHQTIGRIIAALAEAAHVRVLNKDDVGAHGARQVISILGQLLHESSPEATGTIFLPQAGLARGARLLEATAQMIRDGAVLASDIPIGAVAGLDAALERDARPLRGVVGEHGTSTGPSDAS